MGTAPPSAAAPLAAGTALAPVHAPALLGLSRSAFPIARCFFPILHSQVVVMKALVNWQVFNYLIA